MLFTHQFCLRVSVSQRTSTSYALCCTLQLWRHLRRLWESTASLVHHRELWDNYSALGIRQNNLLQLHILTILAIPKSYIRSPLDHLHASSCFSPFQRGFILNGMNQKFQSVILWAPKWQWLNVLHQDCELISERVLLIYLAHVNITCEINWIRVKYQMNHANIE